MGTLGVIRTDSSWVRSMWRCSDRPVMGGCERRDGRMFFSGVRAGRLMVSLGEEREEVA